MLVYDPDRLGPSIVVLGIAMAEFAANAVSSVQGAAAGAYARGRRTVDARFPPQRRREVYDAAWEFARERPRATAFIAAHIALSGIPIAIFLGMTLTVAVFSLIGTLMAGIMVSLVCIASCIGFALLFLIPTLFFTVTAGCCLWAWSMGVWMLYNWYSDSGEVRVVKRKPGRVNVKQENWGEEFRERSNEEAKLNGATSPKMENGEYQDVGYGETKRVDPKNLTMSARQLNPNLQHTGVAV